MQRYRLDRKAVKLEAKGYTFTKEHLIGAGKSIDIVADRAGNRLAYKIDTENSHPVVNFKKCLTAEMDRVVRVGTAESVRNTVGVRCQETGASPTLTTLQEQP